MHPLIAQYRRSIETLRAHARTWYALATTESETRASLLRLRRRYREFADNPPSSPRIQAGANTENYDEALYLHGLLRRDRCEQERYEQLLSELVRTDCAEDVRLRAAALYREYESEYPKWVPPSPQDRRRLHQDARRSLRTLANSKHLRLQHELAHEHVSALIAKLVESKLRLRSALNLCNGKGVEVWIVIPVHREFERLRPLTDTLAGEYFVEQKRKQLQALTEGEDDVFVNIVYAAEDAGILKEVKRRFGPAPGDRIREFTHPGQYGPSKAQNVKSGLQFALARPGHTERRRVFAYTDADLSTHIGQLGSLVYEIVVNRYSAAIGSRAHADSWVYGRDPSRTVKSRAYNILVRLLLGIDWADTQCGFKLFDEASAKIATERAFSEGSMAFDSEVLARLDREDRAIVEVPVVWFESPLESQSAEAHTAWRMLLGLVEQSQTLLADYSAVEDPLSRIDDRARGALLELGLDDDLSRLLAFLRTYYRVLEPSEIREFVSSLKRLLAAAASGRLEMADVECLWQDLRELGEWMAQSRIVDFTITHYPDVMRIVHACIQAPQAIPFIASFFVGSDTVAQFIPGTPRAIRSFYEFRGDRNPDAGEKILRDWLEHCRVARRGSAGSTPQTVTIPGEPEAARGGRASVASILGKEALRASVVVPAMQAVHGGIEGLESEIRNLGRKLHSLDRISTWLRKGGQECPVLKFHVVTGISTLPDEATLARLGAYLPKESAEVYVYGPKTYGGNAVHLWRWVLSKQESRPPMPLQTPGRDVKAELECGGRRPKGTLLMLGIKAAHTEDPNHSIGYIASTGKIAIEEFLLILHDLCERAEANCIISGTRRAADSYVTNKPLINHLRSAIVNALTRSLFPDLAHLSDVQASCKVMTPEAASAIVEVEPGLQAAGIGCDIELLQLASYHGAKVDEVPISFYEDPGVEEGFGGETALDLLTELLELKPHLKNCAQRPCEVEVVGVGEYSVEYLNAGTEHTVFRVSAPEKASLVVKVPHEAIDTEYFFALDALCANVLQGAGWTQATGRTGQEGLVTNLGFLRGLLSTRNERVRKWLHALRNWNEFNGVVLKAIRAYEGKDFKSTGYQHVHPSAEGFIVPFKKLEHDEAIKLAWRSGSPGTDAAARTLWFTGLDHVIIQQYQKHTVEDFLQRELERRKGTTANADAFVACVSAVFKFSIALARHGRLYDIDMNMFSDIAWINPESDQLYARDLRLIDPGEVLPLYDEGDLARCRDILRDRLGVDANGSIAEAIERLDFPAAGAGSIAGARLFDSFQFAQLQMLMEKAGLGAAEKHRVRRECVCHMKKYLGALANPNDKACDHNDSPSTAEFDRWCLVPRNAVESEVRSQINDRVARQAAAVTIGSQIQGRYEIGAPGDVAVLLAARGIALDAVESRVGG